MSVFLRVPPEEASASPWSAIKASPDGRLSRVPSGALTLVRGVTAGIFEATAEGTVRLESARTGCANPCAPDRWTATVVVGH
ncbi:MAG: hypothetical protein NVSMB17_12170 [Candidatus Dormibacteria bacterium]